MLVKGMKEATGKDGTKLKKLLAKGLELAEQIEQLETEKKKIEEDLLAIVAKFKQREDRDPVSLSVAPCDPKGVGIKWNKRYVVDVPTALALEPQLGIVFGQVFSKKIEISRSRSYNSFMNSPQPPNLETMKTKIAECVEEKYAAKPNIKWYLREGKKDDDE
jgi:hypothetical protein